MPGHSTIEQRRYLQIVERAQAERPERVTPYVEGFALLVRAIAIDGGVARAVHDGRRAVELAHAASDEILTGALVGYARALYFAGNLDEAWQVALSVIEHPNIERRVPSHALARATSRSSRSSAGGSSPHEVTPKRRRRSWAGSAPAVAGSARTRQPRSARCLQRRKARGG